MGEANRHSGPWGWLLLLLGCATQPTAAAGLLECRDSRLAGFASPDMLLALEDVGGRGCHLAAVPWGQQVRCEGARASAFGLPVSELNGEISNAGVRRVSVVTRASDGRVRQIAATVPTAEGMTRQIEAREDGATVILCSAAGTLGEGGSIEGGVPVLPVGALGWRVCAEPDLGGAPTCVDAGPGGYRIDGLAAGDYRLRATPIGALDTGIAAVLARRSDLQADAREAVLLDRIAVRNGAITRPRALTLIRVLAP